jgi:hypothetical protein
MTASMSTVIDLEDLDRRIARALAVLRLARVASARRSNPKNLDSEALAESQLNALLEFRYTVVHRSSTPLA